MDLEIKDLNVRVKDKEILKDFSLNIYKGETHAIMGPNGTGKSTLAKVIMGHPSFTIESGDILSNKKSIIKLTTDERAKKGIFLAFQNPLSIEGITTSDFIKTAINETKEEHIGLYDYINQITYACEQLKIDKEMIHRNINENFSGGERKKNEVLQILLLKPKLIILDELDSGLDIDSLKIVCENITKYKEENPNTSILIITHYPRILEMIKPNYVHVMKNGQITKSGNIDFARQIEINGYEQ
ncbi:MAG: Fe-S cluster assembly ATPase SufC [Bacilli bacterium]